MEHQLKPFPGFIRCHRTCIVNINHTEGLLRESGNHWLSIKNHQGQVPVSRQYLMQVKKVLAV